MLKHYTDFHENRMYSFVDIKQNVGFYCSQTVYTGERYRAIMALLLKEWLF